jgi:hypothetical protein
MVNRPKIAGTNFETLMTNYFKQTWPTAYRPAQTGKNDTGDINGMPLPIECKNVKTLAIPQWLRECEREALNAQAIACPLVIKRRGITDPAKQLFVTEAWVGVELMLAWQSKAWHRK